MAYYTRPQPGGPSGPYRGALSDSSMAPRKSEQSDYNEQIVPQNFQYHQGPRYLKTQNYSQYELPEKQSNGQTQHGLYQLSQHIPTEPQHDRQAQYPYSNSSREPMITQPTRPIGPQDQGSHRHYHHQYLQQPINYANTHKQNQGPGYILTDSHFGREGYTELQGNQRSPAGFFATENGSNFVRKERRLDNHIVASKDKQYNQYPNPVNQQALIPSYGRSNAEQSRKYDEKFKKTGKSTYDSSETIGC